MVFFLVAGAGGGGEACHRLSDITGGFAKLHM